jgi:hypothetical protein
LVSALPRHLQEAVFARSLDVRKECGQTLSPTWKGYDENPSNRHLRNAARSPPVYASDPGVGILDTQ